MIFSAKAVSNKLLSPFFYYIIYLIVNYRNGIKGNVQGVKPFYTFLSLTIIYKKNNCIYNAILMQHTYYYIIMCDIL